MKKIGQASRKKRRNVTGKSAKRSAGVTAADRDDTLPLFVNTRAELIRPDQILALQRALGNKAVTEHLGTSVPISQDRTPIIQRVDEEEAPGGEEASPDPDTRAMALFEEGLELIRQGRYYQAIIRLERARQANPGLRNTYWNIAECNWALGRNATAIIYYEQYMTTPGADIEAAEARLRTVRRQAGVAEEAPVTPQPAEAPEGQVPSSQESEAPSEEVSPAPGAEERAIVLFEEGLELIRQGQFRQAIIRLERARQANPGLRNTYWNIAECNWTLGRHATAIIYYEQYMTLPGADRAAAEARLREVRRLAGVEGEAPMTPQPAEEPEGDVPQPDESIAQSEETAASG